MKTRISQLLAALFFVIILAGNVSATDHDAIASSHENIETTLELENWMMDENIWNTSTFHFAEATESTLEMENWMTNEIVWDVPLESLIIETWMTNTMIWDVTIGTEIDIDTDLSMEAWMTSEKIWKI